VVGDAVEHGRGHLGVAEDLGPVGEGEVGGDDDRGVLVELVDQMEEQLCAGLADLLARWSLARTAADQARPMAPCLPAHPGAK
jgi:hypothetical protein